MAIIIYNLQSLTEDGVDDAYFYEEFDLPKAKIKPKTMSPRKKVSTKDKR